MRRIHSRILIFLLVEASSAFLLSRVSFESSFSTKVSPGRLCLSVRTGRSESPSSKKEKEFRWLTWVYQSWKDVPPGQLNATVVKNMIPALSVYAKRQSPKAALQAEELLNRYLQEVEAHNIIACRELSNNAFHAAMDAYAKCGNPQGAQRIFQQLLEWSARYPEQIRPDVFSYTILATAWTRSSSPRAASQAWKILTYMLHRKMPVSTVTYNVVLHALARSQDRQKGMRAQSLVEHMLLQQEQHHDSISGYLATPDLCTYQSLLAAWSHTRTDESLGKALKVWETIEQNPDMHPNTHCYATMIHAWACCHHPERAIRAHQLLQEMKARHEQEGRDECRPNVVVYTSVLNACVVKPADEIQMNETNRLCCYDLGTSVWEELCSVASKYGPPNFLAYGAYLRVVGTALPPSEERDSVVRRVFETCCEYGCLGRIVLDRLKEAASEKLYKEILGGYSSWEELPAYWRRRVKGERYDGTGFNFRLGRTIDRSPRVVRSGSSPHVFSKDTNDEGRSQRASFSDTNNIEWQVRF